MLRGSVNKAGTQPFLPSTCGCLVITVSLYGLPFWLLACYWSYLKRQERVCVYSSAPSPVGHKVNPLLVKPALSCLLKQHALCGPPGAASCCLDKPSGWKARRYLFRSREGSVVPSSPRPVWEDGFSLCFSGSPGIC